jgi:hypothetical protein
MEVFARRLRVRGCSEGGIPELVRKEEMGLPVSRTDMEQPQAIQ